MVLVRLAEGMMFEQPIESFGPMLAKCWFDLVMKLVAGSGWPAIYPQQQLKSWNRYPSTG